MATLLLREYFEHLFPKILVLKFLVFWFVLYLARAFYNVSPLHPLSRFPGPELAAMSLSYEFWFDFVKFGMYTSEIKRMHAKYGPIVRISPDELHCNDPSFINDIYAVGNIQSKRDRSTHFLNGLGGPAVASTFGTADHELHRSRRAALAKFFSRQQLNRVESEVHSLVQTLCDKMLSYPADKAFDVMDAYTCFTTDFIASYCFGHTLGFLDQKDWLPNYRAGFHSVVNTAFVFRFFPFLHFLDSAFPLLARLPKTATVWLVGNDVAGLVELVYTTVANNVRKARADRIDGRKYERPVLFSEILDANIPEQEKSEWRLLGEGNIMMNAGTETVAWTLSVITFHVLSRPNIRDRLRHELRDKVKDPKKLSWPELERIDYLYCVIMEGLRLSYGAAGRIARVATEQVLVYHCQIDCCDMEFPIPKGTPIGMSAAIMHHNEEIFPESDSFNPGRWLDKQGHRNGPLEAHLMSFSKGGRQCIGMNLAYCELYISMAALMLRVFPQIRLYKTSVDDVRYERDATAPLRPKGSLGVRVKRKE